MKALERQTGACACIYECLQAARCTMADVKACDERYAKGSVYNSQGKNPSSGGSGFFSSTCLGTSHNVIWQFTRRQAQSSMRQHWATLLRMQ